MQTAQDIRLFRYKKGATVVIAGTKNPGYFFIVKEGKLAVHSDHVLDDLSIGIFEPGETFGLVSGLTNTEFLGTIVAEEDSVLIRLPLSALGRYLRHNRPICIKMLRSYSRELRSLDHSIAKEEDAHPLEGKVEKMVLNAEVYLHLGFKEKASYALARFLKYALEKNLAKDSPYVEKAQTLLNKINPNYKLPIRDSRNILLKPQDILFLEDEPNDYFYVIKSGYISISRLVRNQEILLAILGPGEVFGEMAILEGQTRLAQAIAHTEAEVIRLTAETFLDVLGEKILYKIFESLAKRIWFGHRRVSIMREENYLLRIYRYLQLLIQREKLFNKDQELKNEISFPFGLAELLQMTAVPQDSANTIDALKKDINLDIRPDQLLIRRISQVEGKIFQLQKQLKAKK